MKALTEAEEIEMGRYLMDAARKISEWTYTELEPLLERLPRIMGDE